MAEEEIKYDPEDDESSPKIGGWSRHSNFDCLFYSSETLYKYIDDDDIIKDIEDRYEAFNKTTTDSVLRKTFIELLNNEDFVSKILEKYAISIRELICIVYRKYSSMFSRPSYAKNIITAITDKSYVKKNFSR